MPKFKLQSVLDHRLRLEDLAKQDLAEVLRRKQELSQTLIREKESFANLQNEFSLEQEQGITAQEIIFYHQHLDAKARLITNLKQALEQLLDEEERKRDALCRASQDKKLLEKFKDKKMLEEYERLRRLENNQFDEIAVQRSFKR